MKLGVKGRYAVTAMLDLCAQPEGIAVSLMDIATRQSLPLSYLEQLFVKLRKAGLVESVRGARGGYRLAQSRTSIRLEDIVLAVDEGMTFTACASRKGCHAPSARCLTHDLWEGLDRHVRSYLSAITLEDALHGNVALSVSEGPRP